MGRWSVRRQRWRTHQRQNRQGLLARILLIITCCLCTIKTLVVNNLSLITDCRYYSNGVLLFKLDDQLACYFWYATLETNVANYRQSWLLLQAVRVGTYWFVYYTEVVNSQYDSIWITNIYWNSYLFFVCMILQH